MEKLRDNTFKHFDLPVNHLTRHGHYVPPKARDEAEIERRRQLPAGTLLAEQQAKGVEVATKLLEFMSDKEDSDFAPKLMAAAGINTAWHNHAQGSNDVMRRRLWLPVHERSKVPVNRESLYKDSVKGFDEASLIASLLAQSIERRSIAKYGFKKKLGIALGNASLVLACVPMSHLIERSLDPYEQQYHTRHAGLAALDDARNLEEQVGANPTMAQLADHDSPMSVYIRRNGTNLTVEALDFATSS